MRYLTVNELPEPPAGKQGFPWTEETPQSVDRKTKGYNLPRISIITPSYNQGQYIEETIRSVLLQGYPNLEYIIIDGGSTDNSVEIITKYEKWLTYWESKPDSGQSHAINKGLLKATGEWINWLNSDDFLLPNALSQLATHIAEFPGYINAVIFACQIVSEDGKSIKEVWHPRKPKNITSFFKRTDHPIIPQPSTFIRMDKMKILEEYHCIMDWILYLQIEDQFAGSFREIDITIAAFRDHNSSKTSTLSQKFTDEAIFFLRNNQFQTKNINRLILQTIQRVEVSQAIGKILSENNRKSLSQLIKLLFNSPNLIINRMFIGAIKKLLWPSTRYSKRSELNR
jgi:glycosyltransferase involved in cell wall biosynthesis